MSDVVVQQTVGRVTVNLGANGAISGASTLTTLNRLTKVTATGTIGMASIAEPTAGNLTGVVSLRASSSAGLLLENSNGDDVLLLGAGPSQGITAYGQISGTSFDSTSASGVITRAAATQDAIRIIGRAGGTSSYIGTITPTTLTASRTWTMPDASIVVAGSASALTSGRVTLATTGGLLSDSSDLTFATRILTIGASDAGSSYLFLRGPAASDREIRLLTGSVIRWGIQASSAAESGSDAGSAFRIQAYADAGTFIDTPFSITRAAGGLIAMTRSAAIGASALLASERLRVAGGTMGTPGTTDVLVAAGRVYSGDTGLTSIRASGGVQIGTQLGVGTAASAAIGINVTQTALTGTTQYGHLLSITGTSSATGAIQGFTIAPATAVASFTCGEVQGIRYQNVSIGSGSSVTTQSAIKIDALSGAANNFAINTAGAGLVLISDTTNATGLGAGGAAIVGLGGASFSRSLWAGGTAGDYINIANSTGELRVNATKVVSSRKTGWTAATGTATRTGFATGTATTTQVAEALKALMDDLISHGLIGA